MKKNIFIKTFFVLATFFLFSGCETVDLNQIEDPSALPANFLDPNYTFNYVQIQLPNYVNSTNDFTQQVTRQMAMTGGSTYDNAFSPSSFDQNWSIAFNILNSIKAMEPKANADIAHYGYALGASKVIRCYVLMTLVDMYGDIPYTEALEGLPNLTPHYDNSAYVYKQILAELDDAIQSLTLHNGKTTTAFNDLYYTSYNNWIYLANTLKLKMYNNSRLAYSDLGLTESAVATNINNIISSGKYINAADRDFAFKYGDSRSLPNDRHPLYNDQYELGGGAYIANYFMWAMSTEKGFNVSTYFSSALADPRLYFYFYKQDQNPSAYNTDTFTLPGRSRPGHYNDDQFASFYFPSVYTPYVTSNWVSGINVADNGFWGRDHGDNSGIPLDANKRTVGGIYPIGGAYGQPGDVQKSGTKGMKGAGIMPIMLSSWVHFIKAEEILKISGVSGVAEDEFLAGINESITKVTNFDTTGYLATAINPTASATVTAALTSNKVAYPNWMKAKYEAANTTKKLEIIIKEYYIAAWGNGIEPYNNYRRTGYPSNMQPTIQPIWGNYFSTAYYPASAVNNNPNTPENVRTKKVFWDKANLILN